MMTPKGTKGLKHRNYPSVDLEQALTIPSAIQDQAAGNPVSRVTLAELVGRSPGSSAFSELLMASRAYGLTDGGANATDFSLTELGNRATGADEVEQQAALREAVLKVEPFGVFLKAHNGKRVPAATPLKEYLVREASVPSERTQECMERLLNDARFVGLLRVVKGGAEWVELNGSGAQSVSNSNDTETEASEPSIPPGMDQPQFPALSDPTTASSNGAAAQTAKPNRVFIAHGKNRGPLEQLKKMLDRFKVPYAVAVDEPHAGRPISAKVANLMRECSAGIFIFTADELFLRATNDGQTQEIFRPSENVVYELGAASVLYDRKIVIFKEESVTFPSDFSDLGHISFKADQLDNRLGDLLHELVGLELLEVRVKA